MADLENISKLTGVCPQSNVQFDFLTVRENLRLFAKIKGIQPRELNKEVCKCVRTIILVKMRLITLFTLSFYAFIKLFLWKCLHKCWTKKLIYIISNIDISLTMCWRLSLSLNIIIHLFLMTTLWGEYHHYAHFTHMETEVQERK